MRLQDKIKEIQEKPEHIRMRYVWGCVIVSMFFIIVLWIFSMTSGRISRDNSGFSGGEILQGFQTQKQSMEDYKNQLKDMQNSFKDLQNQAENQDQTGNQNQDANNANSQDLINSNQ